MKHNFEKAFTLKSYNDDLLIFNGIRVFSFFEIAFGHCYMFFLVFGKNLIYGLKELPKSELFLFMYSCLNAVDVFFWLSGFFMAYGLLDPTRL